MFPYTPHTFPHQAWSYIPAQNLLPNTFFPAPAPAPAPVPCSWILDIEERIQQKQVENGSQRNQTRVQLYKKLFQIRSILESISKLLCVTTQELRPDHKQRIKEIELVLEKLTQVIQKQSNSLTGSTGSTEVKDSNNDLKNTNEQDKAHLVTHPPFQPSLEASRQIIGADPFVDQNSLFERLLLEFESAVELLRCFTDEAFVVQMKNKIQHRKRQLKWRKRKRKTAAVEKKIRLALAKKQDEALNRWRAEVRAKELAKLSEDKLKKDAIMGEQKKQKMSKVIKEQKKRLELLLELRQLRRNRLKRQGRVFPEEDEEFLQKLECQEREMHSPTHTPIAQDKTTNSLDERQSMGNADKPITEKDYKDSQCVSIEQHKAFNSNQRPIHAPWIFPNQERDEWDSERKVAFERLDKANNDIESLLNIRYLWDKYCFPPGNGGTKIPQHFLVPPPPSSSEWEKYLVNSANKLPNST